MQKVSRSIFTGLLVIAGLTACGDKVTVAPNPTSTTTPAPGVVHSVTVAPASVSISIGNTVQLVATVDADAGLARTVTWASTAASKATVSSSGLVTAVASGTVVITATSTADATVSGAATIIVGTVTNASISIASINQGGLPANLNNVAGQVDVTLNVDQGSQSITRLDLIAHNVGTNTDTTVATYSFTSPNKVPASGASASSAPITMSFNTAAFTATTGQVAFINGAYTIRAQATVAGSSNQAPVSSTINYTVNNPDKLVLTAKGDTAANDVNGLQWVGGKISIGVLPVLYSNVALTSVTVTPDAAAANTAPITLTTYPGTAAFAVGKDTITKSPFQATVTAVYSNGQPFSATPINAPTVREDNQAPAPPTVNKVKAGLSRWLAANYAFGAKAADYAAANGDPGAPTTPGVGLGSVHFWAFPNASFTPLGTLGADLTKSGANCKTTGGTLVTTASQLAQSLPADSTTYYMRALQYDKLGNVVCSDLTVAGNGTGAALTFGVDNTLPVNVKYTAATNGTNQTPTNFMLKGTNKAYNIGEFQNITPAATDSISGFDGTTAVTQTIIGQRRDDPGHGVRGRFDGQRLHGAVGHQRRLLAHGRCDRRGLLHGELGCCGSRRQLGYDAGTRCTRLIVALRPCVGRRGDPGRAGRRYGGQLQRHDHRQHDADERRRFGGVQCAERRHSHRAELRSAMPPSPRPAAFGTLNKSATVTMSVPWLISDLQFGNGANGAGQGNATQFNIRGDG